MTPTHRQWVAGFLFDDSATKVVLIRKNRPEWQRGLLNGVGGKVESAEAIDDAMVREFYEETGRLTARDQWHHFAALRWEEGTVHFLRMFDTFHCSNVRMTTDEQVEVVDVGDLDTYAVVPNLRWLVPLAAHRHDTYDLIDVIETGTTLRKPGRLDIMPGSPKAPAS